MSACSYLPAVPLPVDFRSPAQPFALILALVGVATFKNAILRYAVYTSTYTFFPSSFSE